MDDYYAPHPTRRLDEPLVLAGQVGSGVAQIGRAMAARTGIPFSDVDRMVENAVGHSLPHLLSKRGLGVLVHESLYALDRALTRRPPGIVILGSAAVTQEQLQPFLDRARFVFVTRPKEVLFRRVRAQLEANPGSLFQFQLAEPRAVSDLEPLLAARDSTLRHAHAVVEAGDRHANEIATELLGALDRFLGVVSLADP